MSRDKITLWMHVPTDYPLEKNPQQVNSMGQLESGPHLKC